MINEDLENLLTRYIQGELNFTAYRQQRSQLVGEFIEEKKTDVTIPKNLESLQSIKPVAAKAASFQVPTIAREESFSAEKRIQLITVMGLIGFALAAWLLSQDRPAKSNNHNDAGVTQNESDPAVVSNEPFIEAFLTEAIWDKESLSNFLLSWQKLSREKQTEAKKSPAFKQLHNELKLKMNAVSKLKNIGDKNAERQEQLLIWFATQMSINAV